MNGTVIPTTMISKKLLFFKFFTSDHTKNHKLLYSTSQTSIQTPKTTRPNIQKMNHPTSATIPKIKLARMSNPIESRLPHPALFLCVASRPRAGDLLRFSSRQRARSRPRPPSSPLANLISKFIIAPRENALLTPRRAASSKFAVPRRYKDGAPLASFARPEYFASKES